MTRNNTLIFIGLLLLALSVAWFLTPLQEIVLAALRPDALPTRGMDAPAALDLLNTTLNALNAFFGAAGLYLAARGYRLQGPKA